MQLMSLQQLAGPQGGGGGGSPLGGVDPSTSGNDSGTYVTGDTAFPYTEYDRPYSGVPGDMITRWGITLQPGPMRSLLQIARGSDLLPGAREINKILQGYRSYAAQAAAGGTPQNPGGYNPNATTAGNSYHGQGLAIDAGWWTAHPDLARALAAAGWNQLPSESWHWSYGVSG